MQNDHEVLRTDLDIEPPISSSLLEDVRHNSTPKKVYYVPQRSNISFMDYSDEEVLLNYLHDNLKRKTSFMFSTYHWIYLNHIFMICHIIMR